MAGTSSEPTTGYPGHKDIMHIGSGIAAALEEEAREKAAAAAERAYSAGLAEGHAAGDARRRVDLERFRAERADAITAALRDVRERHAQQMEELREANQIAVDTARRIERREGLEAKAKALAEADAAARERQRLAVLEARTDTWEKAAEKQQHAVAKAVAQEHAKIQPAVDAAVERANALAASEAAKTMATSAACQDEAKLALAQEREATARVQVALEEAQRAAADAEERYQQLLEDYRRTLQILPSYEADNNWLL